MNEALFQQLKHLVGKDAYFEREALSRHSSFRIGGPARVLLRPSDELTLIASLELVRESMIPFLVIGKGSNILFDDSGFDGIIIEIARNFSQYRIEGTEVWAQAGISLTSLAKKTARAGLAGLEFASGIPGTLGGGLFMNAGAYGGQLSDVVRSARIINENGSIGTLHFDPKDFGYRSSPLQSDGIILDVQLKLQPDDPEEIQARIAELDERRQSKQPLEYPSAGSTFKRPPGHYASALIDQAGLKGYRVGNAAVSTKHAGFIVNVGGASAADVKAVIAHVQERIRTKFNVELVPEVRIIENPQGTTKG